MPGVTEAAEGGGEAGPSTEERVRRAHTRISPNDSNVISLGLHPRVMERSHSMTDQRQVARDQRTAKEKQVMREMVQRRQKVHEELAKH